MPETFHSVVSIRYDEHENWVAKITIISGFHLIRIPTVTAYS
jgi:hypothetical protein